MFTIVCKVAEAATSPLPGMVYVACLPQTVQDLAGQP